MCGLVGAAGSLTAKDDLTIKRLLMHDFFRGVDSTGLAGIRANGDANIAKLASSPPILFQMKQFTDLISGVNRVFIGHNRASTRGKTNDFNAHPFHYGHIIGAHNGTLDQMSWDRLEKAIDQKFNVDSQALIAAIAKLGIEEAISLCTTGADPHTGAWSLVWFDQMEGTINFLRNKHRPMFYAWDKPYKRLYWASEWWMLDAAGQADGIEFAAEGDKGYRFFPTDEDTHYRFDVTAMLSATTRQKPKVKTIKGREPVAVVTTTTDPFGRTGNPYGNVCGVRTSEKSGTKNHNSTTTSSDKNSTTNSHGKTSPSEKNTSSGSCIHWLGTPAHPYAGYIDERKFDDLAKYGCTWCQQTVDYGDPGITVFEADKLVLCSECSGHLKADDTTPTRIYVPASEYAKLQ